MLCRKPFLKGHGSARAAYPCGGCPPCRANLRRLWTSRIQIESYSHAKSCFVTLTYNDDHLPYVILDNYVEDGVEKSQYSLISRGNNYGTNSHSSLYPRDGQLYMKRLRSLHHARCVSQKVAHTPIRFYLVGEYGDKSWRPHYHLALFGLGEEDLDLISDAWKMDGKSMGFVYVGDLSKHSAGYIAGYVTKKLTTASDYKQEGYEGKTNAEKLDGRHPEFSRSSNRPGIGANSLPLIVDALKNPAWFKEVLESGDVPYVLRVGSTELPLGRYLRTRLRKILGLKKINSDGEVSYGAPIQAIQEAAHELHTLFETWLADTSLQQVSFQKYLSSLDDGKALQQVTRDRNKVQRRTI